MLLSKLGFRTFICRLNGKQRKVRERMDIPSEDGRTEMPQNLRRSVQAKRPFLGHVVPESSKRRGGKYLNCFLSFKLIYIFIFQVTIVMNTSTLHQMNENDSRWICRSKITRTG